jgi:hypothetical protein
MNQTITLKAQLKGLKIATVATFVTATLFLSVMILACWVVKYGMVPCSNNEWLSITIVSALMCTALYLFIGIGLLAYISGLRKRIKRES